MKKNTTGKFLIGSWVSFYPFEIDSYEYQLDQMKEAGLNFNIFPAYFGGGMRMASVCGSVTGAAMVLGLFGMNDTAKLNEYYRRMKENHGGFVTCADLLKRSNEMGIPRREHCDGIIYESIGVVEDILRSEGLLPAE